jgi:hypothetical protein
MAAMQIGGAESHDGRGEGWVDGEEVETHTLLAC